MSWMLMVGLVACGPKPGSGPEPSKAPAFSVVADQVPSGMLLGAFSADGADEVVIAGGDLGGGAGTLTHWSNDSLCVEQAVTEQALWWVHGTAVDDWYAVGVAGTILHQTPVGRVREDVPTDSTLFGVYDSGDRVIAVGGDPFVSFEGEVWAREGGNWSLLADQVPGVLFKVWERWIVGDGVAYHLEGDTLVDRSPPDGARLLTVRGTGDDDVWAVGGTTSPVILHWIGGEWRSIEADPACVSQSLNGVWTGPGEDVWVAGHFGTAARYDGSIWTCADFPITNEHFHAVWGHGDEVLWLGGNLFSQGDNFGTIGRWGGAIERRQAGDCG